MHPILNVIVVNFHHKRGCEVEFSYPKLEGRGENGLPEEWAHLPSIALPDGVHNSDNDTIFFLLPSYDEPGKSVFGISCYRQIETKELLTKSDDVTRTSVQKSVCVISRIPLYGALKSKLEVITQAYFEQRDFSKTDVLSQMYDNLCDMFDENLSDEYYSNIVLHEISVQELFIRFRHRALLLFKLFLLEKKILFIASKGLRLGETMLAVISMFPKMLESGLFTASTGLHKKFGTDDPAETSKTDVEISEETVQKYIRNDTIKSKDGFGFPLSLFTMESYFDPYLPIQFLDSIKNARCCIVGATNSLYATKKDLFDVIVKIEQDGNLVHNHIEIENENLKCAAALTAADLRFADFVLKKVEEQIKLGKSEFDGGDEWIRIQMKNYLLGLCATTRCDLNTAVPHYGIGFVNEWKNTRNYKIWINVSHADISSVPPGHAFAEQIGVYDVYLRFEHAVNGVEGASKVFGTVNTAGKNIGNQIGETGNRMKAKFSNWWNRRTNVDEGQEADESTIFEENQIEK